MSPRQLYQNGLRVPFIAPWSSEDTIRGTIVLRRGVGGEGIGYADEDGSADRRNDTLWVRVPAVRGIGRARLAGVHALRQRQCMTHMLCQVCGESTFGRPDERHLFLVRGDQPIAEGEKTATPPVHESCAAESVRDCPHMRKGAVTSLVEYAPSWGVAGIVYDPQTLQPLPCDNDDGLEFVAYGDPRIRWTLAAREVVTLHGCTTVNLNDLAAQAAV
ncbi:hypothetical protein [Streptomyces sp. 7N604]|uniref:hypothetical protein n=1 Tax=Streptomyces sp. 7N604 TaxID=3457415 RepID=UPI003FD62E93